MRRPGGLLRPLHALCYSIAKPGESERSEEIAMNVSAYLKVDKAAFFKFVASQAEGRFEYEEGLHRAADVVRHLRPHSHHATFRLAL